MNKRELTLFVQRAIGNKCSFKLAQYCVEAVCNGIQAGLKEDKKVRINGIGEWQIRTRASYMAKGLNEGRSKLIPSKEYIHFRASKPFTLKTCDRAGDREKWEADRVAKIEKYHRDKASRKKAEEENTDE